MSIAARRSGRASCSASIAAGSAGGSPSGSRRRRRRRPSPICARASRRPSVYLERHLPLRLEDGRRVKGLVYVADRKHLQYAGRLPPNDLLALVRQGRGSSGENPDYVLRTHEHLRKMGIFDPVLAGLAQQLAPGLAAPHAPLGKS